MLKKLSKLAIVSSLLAFGVVTPNINNEMSHYVHAETTIDFEQGSRTDEEYLDYIIEQIYQSDVILMTSEDENVKSETIMDSVNDVTYSRNESEFGIQEYYFYSDGSSATSAVSQLETVAMVNYDKEVDIAELTSVLEGKYLLFESDTSDTSDMGLEEFDPEIDLDDENYNALIDGLEFTSIERDGDKVIYSTDEMPIGSVWGMESLEQYYGEDTTVKYIFTIDPAVNGFIYESIITAGEKEETEEADDSLGINIMDFFGDSHTVMTVTPTDTPLPTKEELDIISTDEFNQLLIERDLTPLEF